MDTKLQKIPRKISSFLKKIKDDDKQSVVIESYNYICEYNNNKTGASSTDLIYNAIDVALIAVNEANADYNTFAAALLFVSVEKDILRSDNEKNLLPLNVKKIISGLLKIPRLKSEKYTKQTDNFIKLLLTITEDIRAIIIRLAIQIYRMRNIEDFTEDEQKIFALQTKELFAPLAHRLGLYNIKTELEETSMKYSDREMYKFIANKLNDTKAIRDKYISAFIKPLSKTLKKEGFKFEIKGRPKSISSIWKKMQKQGVPFEEVYDLFAIRIILKTDFENYPDSKEELKKIITKEKNLCWKVYSIITDLYRPNPKRLRDWISSPKAITGYESLHATVIGKDNNWIEVQIRTDRMDEIAEKGIAAHWKYKETGSDDKSDLLSKMRNILESPNYEGDNQKEKAKSDLYSEEIFIFTPEGDLKSLKAGYTVLDFAFSIHSQIGETCTGAVVNGTIKTLSYELKNGDSVKILTAKNKTPNNEWLNIAKSTKAKNKIRQALKAKEYKFSQAGKEIIKQKLSQLKVPFTDKYIKKLSKYFNLKTPVELYEKIGEGKIDVLKIKKALTEIEENQTEKLPEIYDYITDTSSISHDDFLLIDDNLSTLDYQFAKCCNPIPGDNIFGFITVSKGTRIHKKACPNAKDMTQRYPYRVVKAKWNIKNENADFLTNILISGRDQTGISLAISKIIIEDFKLKMKAITLTSGKDGKFFGTIVVLIKNKKQLAELIDRLRRIEDIISVAQK